MNKKKFTPEEMERINESFERTDKLILFKKALSSLINSYGIDNLLNVPDYVLSSVAVGQMEICSSVIHGAQNHSCKMVLVS